MAKRYETNRSLASIVSLRQRLETLFDQRSLVLLHEHGDLIWPSSAVVDVVIMGGAPSLFLRSVFWLPRQPMRLWVLSSTNKSVLTKLLGVHPRYIGVIPRSLLYPELRRKVTAKGISKRPRYPTEIVLCSRNTRSKNMKVAVAIAAKLQEKLFCLEPEAPIRPVKIFGPRLTTSAVDRLRTTVRWLKKPTSYGSPDRGTAWVTTVAKNAVFIHMSTSYEEDFGVAVAQAECKGLSLILSHWGAHIDITSPVAVYVSTKEIEMARSSKLLRSRLAAKTVSAFVKSSEATGTKRERGRNKAQPQLPKVEISQYTHLASSLQRLSPKLRRTIAKLFRDESTPRSLSASKLQVDNYFASGGTC